MSCDTNVVVSSSVIVVKVDGTAVTNIETSTTPIVCDIQTSTIVCELLEAPPIVIEVGTPGLKGEDGTDGTDGIGLPTTDLRVDIALAGIINSSNKSYALPGGEKAVNLSASGSASIEAFYNGKRLEHGAANDFIESESGGVGTGIDTITFVAARPPPRPGDKVTANWIKSP